MFAKFFAKENDMNGVVIDYSIGLFLNATFSAFYIFKVKSIERFYRAIQINKIFVVEFEVGRNKYQLNVCRILWSLNLNTHTYEYLL